MENIDFFSILEDDSCCDVTLKVNIIVGILLTEIKEFNAIQNDLTSSNAHSRLSKIKKVLENSFNTSIIKCIDTICDNINHQQVDEDNFSVFNKSGLPIWEMASKITKLLSSKTKIISEKYKNGPTECFSFFCSAIKQIEENIILLPNTVNTITLYEQYIRTAILDIVTQKLEQILDSLHSIQPSDIFNLLYGDLQDIECNKSSFWFLEYLDENLQFEFDDNLDIKELQESADKLFNFLITENKRNFSLKIDEVIKPIREPGFLIPYFNHCTRSMHNEETNEYECQSFSSNLEALSNFELINDLLLAKSIDQIKVEDELENYNDQELKVCIDDLLLQIKVEDELKNYTDKEKFCTDDLLLGKSTDQIKVELQPGDTVHSYQSTYTELQTASETNLYDPTYDNNAELAEVESKFSKEITIFEYPEAIHLKELPIIDQIKTEEVLNESVIKECYEQPKHEKHDQASFQKKSNLKKTPRILGKSEENNFMLTNRSKMNIDDFFESFDRKPIITIMNKDDVPKKRGRKPKLNNLSEMKSQNHKNAEICILWIQANFKEGSRFDPPIMREHMYALYIEHCDEFKHIKIDIAYFGKCVRKVFQNLKSRRLLVCGMGLKYHYVEIKAKNIVIERRLSLHQQMLKKSKNKIQRRVLE